MPTGPSCPAPQRPCARTPRGRRISCANSLTSPRPRASAHRLKTPFDSAVANGEAPPAMKEISLSGAASASPEPGAPAHRITPKVCSLSADVVHHRHDVGDARRNRVGGRVVRLVLRPWPRASTATTVNSLSSASTYPKLRHSRAELVNPCCRSKNGPAPDTSKCSRTPSRSRKKDPSCGTFLDSHVGVLSLPVGVYWPRILTPSS